MGEDSILISVCLGALQNACRVPLSTVCIVLFMYSSYYLIVIIYNATVYRQIIYERADLL